MRLVTKRVITKRSILDPIIRCQDCGVEGEYDRDRIFYIRHKLDCNIWCGCCGQYFKLATGGLCSICEFVYSRLTLEEMNFINRSHLDDANAFLMERVAIMRHLGRLRWYESS